MRSAGRRPDHPGQAFESPATSPGATHLTASLEELFIVSDLHLGAAAADRGGAFAGFVRAMTGDSGRLVLLGDSLDLPTHVSGARADATERWGTLAVGAM